MRRPPDVGNASIRRGFYLFFLIANVILLIAGALTVRENKFNLGETEPYREIVPVSCERTQDGRRQYIFDMTSDGMDNALMFFTGHQEIWAYADDELIYSRGKVDTIFSQILNQLLDKFNEYKTIVNYRMEYIFADHSGKLYLEDILL